MMRFNLLLLIMLIMAPATGLTSVKAYFNHYEGSSYVDPYRNIPRSGHNLEAVILEQIANAKKSIYVAVQELRLPLIARALIEKKNAGVDVRVVLEHDYNFNVATQRDSYEGAEYEATRINDLQSFVDANRNGRFEKEELETRDAIYMLQKAKVPLMDDASNTSQGSGLMHHKFMIVDGKSTVISTANFTMSCIHGDYTAPTTRGNANSLMVVGSVALADIFTNEFKQLWGNGKHGNFGHSKTYRGAQSVTVRGTKITVQFSPTSRKYPWEDSVNGLIASSLKKATDSVKGALFVFSDQRLADSIQGLHEKNVKVGFLIERKFAFREYSELLDMMGVQLLNEKCVYEPDNNPWNNPVQEAGVPNLVRGDMLHHKFAVVGGTNNSVIVGSQNWSDSANYVNDETLLVVENTNISSLYDQEYERLKRKSQSAFTANLMNEIQKREQACAGRGIYF